MYWWNIIDYFSSGLFARLIDVFSFDSEGFAIFITPGFHGNRWPIFFRSFRFRHIIFDAADFLRRFLSVHYDEHFDYADFQDADAYRRRRCRHWCIALRCSRAMMMSRFHWCREATTLFREDAADTYGDYFIIFDCASFSFFFIIDIFAISHFVFLHVEKRLSWCKWWRVIFLKWHLQGITNIRSAVISLWLIIFVDADLVKHKYDIFDAAEIRHCSFITPTLLRSTL